jgi:hypothetical protein
LQVLRGCARTTGRVAASCDEYHACAHDYDNEYHACAHDYDNEYHACAHDYDNEYHACAHDYDNEYHACAHDYDNEYHACAHDYDNEYHACAHDYDNEYHACAHDYRNQDSRPLRTDEGRAAPSTSPLPTPPPHHTRAGSSLGWAGGTHILLDPCTHPPESATCALQNNQAFLPITCAQRPNLHTQDGWPSPHAWPARGRG